MMWTRTDSAFAAGTASLLLALVVGGWLSWPAHAQVVRDKGLPVAGYTQAEVAHFEALLAASRTPEADSEALDEDIEASAHFTDADEVVMTAGALQALMAWDNEWRPGFEAYLRTVQQMGDQQIVVAVYSVFAQRAVLLADLTLAELSP